VAMYPKFILSTSFILLCLICKAQQINKKQLLDNVNTAVEQINEGQYNFHDTYSKVAIGEDSVKKSNVINCFFKKLPTDTLTGYQLASFTNYYKIIYDGDHLWTEYNAELETADKTSYPEKIKELKTQKHIYPFYISLNQELQDCNKEAFLKNITITGIELYAGEPCYKLQMTAFGGSNTKVSDLIFVSVASFIPKGQIIILDKTIAQAHEVQTFNYWISDFKQDKLLNGQFSKEKLTGYIKEKAYDPAIKINTSGLLPVGTIAPDWELPLVTGNSLKLSSLKGKVVVLDFWYKACLPCQEQMMQLEPLRHKYDNNKVVFIGVNTIDDPIKDKLKLFLDKRNISILTVYNGKNIESIYNAPYSPALFVVGKDGKIIYTQEGFSEDLLKNVSAAIDKQL
jgi:peroxiredoxin